MRHLKILLVFGVMCFIGTVSFAQVETIEEVKTEVQEKTEVLISDLPQTVTKTLKDKYADYVTSKASSSIQDNGTVAYTVSLLKDKETTEVTIDSEGNVVEKGKAKRDKI